MPEAVRYDTAASRRRGFRHNLFLLLGLTLAAFTLTIWILVRVDSPFGIFSTGPQEIVRAQLLYALDRGELRPRVRHVFRRATAGRFPSTRGTT